MKKICCMVVALILAFGSLASMTNSGLAEKENDMTSDEDFFFSNATPADLLYLRNQVNDLLHDPDVFETVSVPVGVYQVGVDIPEGKWTLSASVNSAMELGSHLKSNGKEIAYSGSDYYVTSRLLPFLDAYLYKNNTYFKTIYQTINFPTNCYVAISRGTVEFSTYIGQPDFLFYAKNLPAKNVVLQFDCSTYSFDKLVQLKNRINLALWSSYSWDRIIVPAGLYQVGVDIPAGYWNIEAPEDYTRISYGTKLYDRYMGLEIYDDWEQEIENKNYRNYKEGEDVSIVDLTIVEGAYIQINENTCASFSPATEKKVVLGFKQYATEQQNNSSDENGAENYLLFSFPEDENTSSSSVTISNGQNIQNNAPNIYNGVEYELIDYEAIARNPNSYKGKQIYFIGKVIQVSESTYGSSTTYRIQLENSSDVVLVHKYTKTEPRVLENDKVLVYGTCNGVESYQSVLSGQITIPSCTATEIRDSSKLPERKPDPLLITGCQVGDAPFFSVKNNSGINIKEMGFRARYYNSDGSFLITDKNNTFSYEGYLNNGYFLSVQFDLSSGEEMTLTCEEVEQFKNAAWVDVAVSYFIGNDESVYYVPEPHLMWYSSKTSSFLKEGKQEFIYHYPTQEQFDKANTFMLGVTTARLYPEYLKHYGISDVGYYVIDIQENSLLSSLDIVPGDIILKCAGADINDEPFALELGKVKLVEGNNVDIVISRKGIKHTITITPEMVTQFQAATEQE